MVDDKIIESNTQPRVVDTLIEEISETEKVELQALKSLDIDVEQAEYLQTIG